MKRLMVAAGALVGALLLAACPPRGGTKGPGDWDDIKTRDRHESSPLKITLQGSRCTLSEAPEQIRARWGHRVTFVVEGSCNADQKITIGNFQLETGDVPADATPSAPTAVDAKDGEVLKMDLKPRDSGHGLWQYDVLVNGTRIGTSADTAKQSLLRNPFEVPLHAFGASEFAICPDWPCSR